MQIHEHQDQTAWINQQQIDSSTIKFSSLILDPNNPPMASNVDTRPNTFTLKAVSSNKKCVLYFDSATSKLMVFDLLTQAYVEKTNVIKPSLYSGIDLSTAQFDVSNDCSSVRINNKVFHVDS